MNSCKGPSPIYTGKGDNEQPLLPGEGGGSWRVGGLLSKIIFFAEIVLLKFLKIFLGKDLLTDSHFNKTNFKVHITYLCQRYHNQLNQNGGT